MAEDFFSKWIQQTNITVTEFFHADPETEIVKTEQEKLVLQSFRSMEEDFRLRMMGYVQAQ